MTITLIVGIAWIAASVVAGGWLALVVPRLNGHVAPVAPALELFELVG